MLESVIKRDGRMEAADADKLLRWSSWAARGFEDRANWEGIVRRCLRVRDRVLTTKALNNRLKKLCVRQKRWAYQIMAGRLEIADLRKELYDNKIPTVHEQYFRLNGMKLVEDMPYTAEEFEQLQAVIDHTQDETLAYYQVRQLARKYSIQLENTGQIFETPQFIFMRMAMSLAMREKREKWVESATMFYRNFSGVNLRGKKPRVSNPTPNYLNLGTGHRGYASCCLIAAGDDAESIGIAVHIAYTMTYMSCGIGTIFETRSIADPVRGGKIVHNGKGPYLEYSAKAVKANTQGGRGGAQTTHGTCFDPEIMTMLRMQNPRTPASKRNRDLHLTMKWNAFFAEAVLNDRDIFLFNVFTAPDLHEAIDTASLEDFTTIYNRYEADETFVKKYVKARDVAYLYMQQRKEVSTNYDLQIDYANHHTPHNDRIRSSNLCVTGDTKILTDIGHVEIATLRDQEVDVWNGEEFSKVTVNQTSESSELITVKLSNGLSLTNTLYHKYYIQTEGSDKPFEIEARHLRTGMKLIDFELPVIEGLLTETTSDTMLRATYAVKDRLDWLYNTLMARGACLVHPDGSEALAMTPAEGDKGWLKDAVLMLQTLGIKSSIKNVYGQVRLVIHSNQVTKLKQLGLDYGGIHTVEVQLAETADEGVYVEIIAQAGTGPTYCFSEPKRHMGLFNGILTGQCTEILQPTEPYYDMQDLYKEDHRRGEVSMCSLAGIPINNIDDDDDEGYFEACYVALKTIDNAIHQANYKFPHIKYTATSRMNAGVGILGLATWLARKGLKYDTPEGLAAIDWAYQRHMYFLIEASLKLGQELGNAPWMDRTKWPQGWLPIDTYNRNIDEIVPHKLYWDWEDLRARVIANGGIRNSSLATHMPTESSSKAVAAPNCAYPVRDLTLAKTDLKNAIDWCAPDNDILEDQYQIAYDIAPIDMIKVYGVIGKWTDQTISADTYDNRQIKPKLSKRDLIVEFLARYKYGVKSSYYNNSFLESPDQLSDLEEGDEGDDLQEEQREGAGAVCTTGGCTL